MTRIEREQRTVAQMIGIYCRHKEHNLKGHKNNEHNEELCADCAGLLEYALTRLSKCPFGESKTSCRKCTVHCYRPDMKLKIKAVMRYSGPRMILYHPITALRHIIAEL